MNTKIIWKRKNRPFKPVNERLEGLCFGRQDIKKIERIHMGTGIIICSLNGIGKSTHKSKSEIDRAEEKAYY